MELPVDIHDACEKAMLGVRRRVLEALDEIVDAVIARAKKGKYLDAKFLVDLAGLRQNQGETRDHELDGEALMQRFLEITGVQMKEQHPAQPAVNL